MALSKTQIDERMAKKTNPYLSQAIFLAKKNNLLEIASAISVPTRMQAKVNLEQINKSKGDVVIVPGKVLSLGEVSKKIKVYSIGISEKAMEKLKKAGGEYKPIWEALKENNKLKGEIIK